MRVLREHCIGATANAVDAVLFFSSWLCSLVSVIAFMNEINNE